jgi:hypothetical protein
MNATTHFSFTPHPFLGRYELHLWQRLSPDRVAIPETTVTMRSMKLEEAPQTCDPWLTLERADLQSLIDQLWQLGIRPTEGHGSTGQLAATERHLEHTTRLLDSTLQTVQNVVNASLLTTHNLTLNTVTPATPKADTP